MTDDLKHPKNWFERLLWLHGRKFYLAMFAGASQFAVTLAALLSVVAISGALHGTVDEAAKREIGRLIVDLIGDYLLSSAGIVVAYSGSNAIIERSHAGHTPEKPQPRQTGAVRSPDA